MPSLRRKARFLPNSGDKIIELTYDDFGNIISQTTQLASKVLVKKMLDTHVSPWVDNTSGPLNNLFETAAISFTVL